MCLSLRQAPAEAPYLAADVDRAATDFVSGADKFLFASLAFSNTASFNATGAAIGTNAQFIYNTSSGLLSYDSNGTLGGGSSNIATLAGPPMPTLVAADVLNFI